MPKSMNIEIMGNTIRLQRNQWQGNYAYISNYPGLIDEVKKYTWTYVKGNHPYLRCNKIKMYLHQFVLLFLYGKEKLDEMIGKSNIIEHLDNDGLNCTYENLHILSEDMNKAKAFSIDKKRVALQTDELASIPALITDVYYSHEHRYFQLQVFFNKSIVFNTSTGALVETVLFQYYDFDNLYIDWLYCYECIKAEEFDVYKHHAARVYVKYASVISLEEHQKDAAFVERDGKHYLVLRTDSKDGYYTYMDHISFRRIEDE